MLTGYGGGYQYGPVTTSAPQQPHQQRNTGDELVAELMQATQGVSICPSMWLATLIHLRLRRKASLNSGVECLQKPDAASSSVQGSLTTLYSCAKQYHPVTPQDALHALHVAKVCSRLLAHSVCEGLPSNELQGCCGRSANSQLRKWTADSSPVPPSRRQSCICCRG